VVEGADVVVTAASFAPPSQRQSMTNAWLRPGATIVPVDYATMCAAEVARGAGLFLVDQRDQFLANREAGQFDGYPDPTATLGEAILAGTPRPEGWVVVTHLGVGLADVVFADVIVRAATAAGRGTTLPR
jgi:ornithine cyclodeaminase/alanine dehydrogenase-like protein (mu-crystallin family)